MLILHGAEDQFTPVALLKKLEPKLKAGHAKYQVVIYPGAKHGFTDPGADRVGETHHAPVGYNAEADAKSWAAMQQFFKQVL